MVSRQIISEVKGQTGETLLVKCNGVAVYRPLQIKIYYSLISPTGESPRRHTFA